MRGYVFLFLFLFQVIAAAGAVDEIQVPMSSAAIAIACEWMGLEWHSSESHIAVGTQRVFVGNFVAKIASDPPLFASAVLVADFLAVDNLLGVLLGSFGAGEGLLLVSACLSAVPALPTMLYKRLGLASEAEAEAFLRRLEAQGSTPEILTWADLELCDGLHLAPKVSFPTILLFAAALIFRSNNNQFY